MTVPDPTVRYQFNLPAPSIFSQTKLIPACFMRAIKRNNLKRKAEDDPIR